MCLLTILGPEAGWSERKVRYIEEAARDGLGFSDLARQPAQIPAKGTTIS